MRSCDLIPTQTNGGERDDRGEKCRRTDGRDFDRGLTSVVVGEGQRSRAGDLDNANCAILLSLRQKKPVYLAPKIPKKNLRVLVTPLANFHTHFM